MYGSLVVSGPLDVARTLSRFHLWGEDPANRLSDGVFRRAVRVDGGWRGYELTWTGGPDRTSEADGQSYVPHEGVACARHVSEPSAALPHCGPAG